MSSFRDRPLQVDGTAVEVIQALKLEPRIMRYELSEYDWSGVKPMLPNKPRGVPRVNDRRVLNGILWVLRSGARWRDLPENFGPYTCYNRFVRWRRDQIMEAFGHRSRRRGDGSVGLAAQEGRDIENVFLDRVAHRRGAAVRIEALRSRMARIFRNRRLRRSPFGVAGRRAKRRTR
jgi:transposase